MMTFILNPASKRPERGTFYHEEHEEHEGEGIKVDWNSASFIQPFGEQ